MATILPPEAHVSDVDAQYEIAVAEMLESARLGRFEVGITTNGGESTHGVPGDPRPGSGPRTGHCDDWRVFSLGSSTVRLEEIVCCTLHSRHSLEFADGGGDDASGAGPLVAGEARPADPDRGPHLHVSLPADLRAPATARHLTATFLGHAATLLSSDAKLIVSELVSNVVLHAYDEGSPGTVALDLSLEDPTLTILVSDAGRGPRAGSPRGRGHRAGLGWMIVAQLSEDFIITQRGHGGTLIEVRLSID
jgi:anti-sigma regulatory factor (Ser/Thr protein kinase)